MNLMDVLMGALFQVSLEPRSLDATMEIKMEASSVPVYNDRLRVRRCCKRTITHLLHQQLASVVLLGSPSTLKLILPLLELKSYILIPVSVTKPS